MPVSEAKSIRVTISLRGEVYKEIKRISRQLGLRPSTWISMVATSKANNVEVEIKKERK